MLKHSISEHQVSFIAVDQGSTYRVDSELFATAYASACDGDVYNFQVWSGDPTLSESLVGDIISYLAGVGSLSYTNNSAKVLPQALINVGSYRDATLSLAITSDSATAADVTVVAWTYPNPTPNVTVFQLA